MRRDLRYGEDSVLPLDVPPASILGDFSAPRGEPLDDPTAAVAAALDHPLDFPPLSRSTFPGDRVAIALDRDVPQVEAVLAGVVHVLCNAGAHPSDLSVVQAAGTTGNDCLRLLPTEIRTEIKVETHNPNIIGDLMYLAANKDSRPIYFNRTIGQADVVLPVGILRVSGTFGYFGPYSGLYPTFSDDATQKRFRERVQRKQNSIRQRRNEAAEAAWLLGVQFSIQVAPGPGNTVLHVIAGETHAVAREGRRLCEAAWLHRPPRRASLVVATIEGNQSQQTWENFARALFSASRVVTEDGAIVLCTELRAHPGPALQHLAAEENNLERPRKRPTHADDAMFAALLKRLRRRTRVYLLSGLEEDLVQGLGMGYVADPSEISTLGRKHDSCILIGNAHHALPAAEEA